MKKSYSDWIFALVNEGAAILQEGFQCCFQIDMVT